MPADYRTTTTRLVAALADMSPLARTKIRATLEDMSQEITWNYWTKVFQPLPEADAEKKACGCLMLDGYLKEHPPEFIFIEEFGTGGHWITVDPEDWESVLADFYEMVDDDQEDAVDRISNTANAYDAYVKHNKHLVKRVGGVEVLRTPTRRELVKLVDQAEAMAKARQ